MNDYTPLPPRSKTNWPALILSALVHLLLIGALFLGVQWKREAPSSVAVEVWRMNAPQGTKTQIPKQTQAPKTVEPVKQEPKPEPQPTPPKAQPKPTAQPRPTEQPVAKPDIAIKDKKPQPEKKPEPPKKQEKIEKPAKKPDPKPEVKPTQKPEPKPEPKSEPKPETKPTPPKRVDFSDQLAKEKRQIAQQNSAAQEARARNRAEELMRGQLDAELGAANARGKATYIDKIRTKVRGNIVLPRDIQGNPEAEFSVTQLPSGDIIDVRLKRSSGNTALDQAIERAIRKSSPLPRPDDPSLFERDLSLKYKPFEQ